jgi:hypothetical protein
MSEARPPESSGPRSTLQVFQFVIELHCRKAHRHFRLEIAMKYISSWKLPPNLIDSAIEKFLKTGGVPPEGIKMLGRWHGMNGTGFAISESDDAKAMYQWCAQWANVMEITVTPCVEDAEAGPILAALAKQ